MTEVALARFGPHEQPGMVAAPPVEEALEIVVEERVGVVHEHMAFRDPRA